MEIDDFVAGFVAGVGGGVVVGDGALGGAWVGAAEGGCPASGAVPAGCRTPAPKYPQTTAKTITATAIIMMIRFLLVIGLL